MSQTAENNTLCEKTGANESCQIIKLLNSLWAANIKLWPDEEQILYLPNYLACSMSLA